MSALDENKSFYNRLYRRRNPLVSLLHATISFDQQSKSKINYRLVRSFLKKRFDQPLTILDYGFGHGSLLLKFPRHHRLFGCDISDEAVFNFPAVAALVGKKVKTVRVEDFVAELKDVRFDVISLSHVIEHVDDDVELVTRLAAQLSHDGVMLINVPINEVWVDPKHVRTYTRSSAIELMTKCRLRTLAVLEADKFTSFFLEQEMVKKAGKIKIVGIKFLRLLSAFLPIFASDFIEKLFLKRHRHQQLIVLAGKELAP